MPVPKLILILLCLCFAAFSPDTESASPGAPQSAGNDGADENIVFEDDDPGLSVGDGAENISFEDSSQEVEENIRFEPLDVPETDFTQATVEPVSEADESSAAVVEMKALSGELSQRPQYAARGRVTGDDTDVYRLVTEGDAQLWYIEVSGASLSRVDYVDAANQRHVARKIDADGDVRFVIANLLLLPGEHRIRVEGDEVGEYTVRAVALGPPDPGSEVEPNDDPSRARKIPVGANAHGLIYPERDKDFFRFSLHAEELVRISFEPPDSLSARIELRAVEPGGGTNHLLGWRSDQPGDRLAYDRALPPGDYLLSVAWNGDFSNMHYRLRVDRLDPWSMPDDLEPNNDEGDALPLPEDKSLRGTVSGADDDWYRMPVVAVATKVALRPAGPRPRSLALLEGSKNLLAWNEASGAYEGELQAGLQTHLRVRGAGPYEFDVSFDPPVTGSTTASGPLPVRIAFAQASLPFAAYLDRPQAGRFRATVTNDSDEQADLDLEVRSSHYAWQPSLSERRITLAAGASRALDVAVDVARDAYTDSPVRISLGARDPSGRVASASLDLTAQCSADPVDPKIAGALPDPLLGGLNVAWSALGGQTVVADGKESKRLKELNDGLTPINLGWFEYLTKTELPLEVTIDLAGEEPVPVAGVLLHPLTNRATGGWVRDFDILLSEDGVTYRDVMSGTLQQVPVEQAFVFESAIPARFAKLRVRSTQADDSKEVSLGEWKVIASPAAHIAGVERRNLATPEIGGHVVWSTWRDTPAGLASMLQEDSRTLPRFRADPNLPNQWVVGFHHDRAAQIEELQWTDHLSPTRPLTRVQIATSTAGPIGPWQPAGTWELERGEDGVRPFRFPTPTWARFVRFSTTEPDLPKHWDLPKPLRILERPVGDDYRSIVGEWGHYSRQAGYELRETEEIVADNESASNDRRTSAQPLEPGVRVHGNVRLGQDIDWYAVDVPTDANTLSMVLSGAPRLKARVTLFDESGEPLPDAHTVVKPLQTTVEASVTGGSRVFARVEEPPRAVAFVWDNSGSVSRYRETIYQSMSRFGGEIEPGLEFGNLLPFQDDGGSFLLREWSDQPHQLQAAVNNYDRKDGSSAAESALLVASNAFEGWDGTRAAVVLTDAETTSLDRTAQLWQSLANTFPHFFTLHLHTNDGIASERSQDLMQSWASVNGGTYTFFRTQTDLDVAFERAACHIRRPANYVIEAATLYEEPPGPGFLSVEADDTLAANAVELILDASGSMLQRLDGTRRIEIARNVLTDLVNETIPEGTSLALRVFGHRKPDACDTDLAVPLQPLDRAKVSGIIQSTQAMNLARTPIGESLARVADDLKDVDGQKLILLITDGEETCDGDPAGAIANLKEAGHDVRINIVGFAIDDAALEAEFESWARMGGGLYFNAGSAEELDRALKDAMRPKFQVLDDTGATIAADITGGEALELPAGTYTLKVLTSPVQTFDQVRIKPGETTTVSASAD